jgi:hypothetical protein
MIRTCMCAVFAAVLAVTLPGRADEAKKPKGKLTIGKETTYVTGPLTKDGYIDYGAALNERMRGKITQEQNAVALLCQVLGPYPEGSAMPPKFYEWLGIPEPAKKGHYFIGSFPYMKKHLELDPESKLQNIQNGFDAASERPWKTKDFRIVAGWLTANEEPLKLLHKAVQRPGYFSPLVSKDAGGGVDGLIASLIPGVQRCRELANCLQTRVMWHLGEGRYDDAWQDVLTCHRLGRQVGRGGTLIEGLVGLAIDHLAHHTAVVYLDVAKPDAKKVQACLRDLQALRAMPGFADKLELAERFLFLETIQNVERRGVEYLENLLGLWGRGVDVEIPREVGQRLLNGIDWDPALRKSNRWIDRIAAILRVKDRGARGKQLDEIEKELKELRPRLQAMATKILKGEQPSAQARGELAGDILVALLTPAFRKAQEAGDRNQQLQRNLHVAFALVAYQREHKAYPKMLDALTPKYLAEIPSDLYSGKALLYRPSEKGFVVYSVGPNGRDEGGQWLDDNPAGDDPRVRLPLTAPR